MEFEKPNLYRIYAVIYVERDSQKGIIIGKKGAAIKQIGTEARADLEQDVYKRQAIWRACGKLPP